MNAPLGPLDLVDRPPTTRAGDGYDRKAWTVDELYAMVDAGILEEDSPVELIDGELLAVSPKYNRHELWKQNLNELLVHSLPPGVVVSIEPTLKLSADSAPEPDIIVRRRGILPMDVRGPDVLLLIEVCDTSSCRDLVLKAGLYARHGVADYWVMDAENRRAVLHRQPSAEGYGSIETFSGAVELPLPYAPDVRIPLADLDRL